jgi:hypothetical protein
VNSPLVPLEARVGDAQDAVAVQLEPRVLAPVAIDLLHDRVVRAAIELDGKMLPRPVAVDLPGTQADVALRRWNLGMPDQPAVEGALQGRLAVGVRAVFLTGSPHRDDPALPEVALERRRQLGNIEQVAPHRLLDQPLESISRRSAGRGLDQQSRDRAQPQPVADPDLGGVGRLAHTANEQAGAPARGRAGDDRDLEPGEAHGLEPPAHRRGPT